MKHLTTVLFLVAALLAQPAMAAPPVFNGNNVSPTMPRYNVLWYGAKGDGTTDDTAAFNAAISAAATLTNGKCGGTVYAPQAAAKYLILGALTVPTTTGANGPIQCPVRLTGDGGTMNGYWSTSPVNGGTILDMRYTGSDGLHPAKIDTRGAGYLEIDHLTLEDTSSDNFLFFQTTNTTVYIHDNAFVGNPANSTTACTQDAIRLGGSGYSTTGSITSGTKNLTINQSKFTSAMVGWNITIGGVGNFTIATYVSPTQVTISSNAGATVTNNPVTFYGSKTSDIEAPFQGYGSVIARNYYSHIQRGVIWGIYANNVIVEDETYANTDGSALTYGAPYYFESNTDVQDGNVIRGSTVEVTGYPYLVSLQGFQAGNSFMGIGSYDHNGTTLGLYYFGGNALHNIVVEGQGDAVLNPSLAVGPGAYANTIVSNGTGNVASSFNYAVNANGTAGRGHAFQIDGHDTLYSDSGASDVNLWLAAPGNTGAINFVTGNGTGAVTNQRVLQIGGLNALSGDGGSGIILQSQGAGGTVKLYDSASSPAPVTMGALSATSLNTTATTNTLNTWHFNPTDSANFYIGSVSTTAATVHFRTNGYSNADTALITSTGAWQGAHNACTASSGLPCAVSGSCALSAATTCNFTVTVPSTALCNAMPNASDTTTVVEQFKTSLSTNTLTVTELASSSQTATAAANVTCI